MTNKKKQPRNIQVVPKQVPIDVAEITKASEFLTKWKQDIDDRLFRDGYELRDGVLYELNGATPIDADTYWKKRQDKGLGRAW